MSTRRQIVINLEKTEQGYTVKDIEQNQIARRQRPTVREPPQVERKIEKPRQQVQQPPQHSTMPVSATWFDIDRIHSIQKKSLPQFFVQGNERLRPGKNEATYLYYRNTMIGMWKENTKKYLSPSICRRALLGDVCSIMRVYTFLENWGIINFPSRQVKGQIVSVDKRSDCFVCSNKASIMYIYNQDDIEFQVCSRCFDQQMYPSFMEGQGWTVVDSTEPETELWSQPEIQKLVGMVYSNKGHIDWGEIASVLGKTKQKALLQFLKLPAYKLSQATSIFDNGQDVRSAETPTDYHPTIFQDYRNPIQIGVAAWTQYEDELTNEIMSAARIHSDYLRKRAEYKIDVLVKLLIDLNMNKVQSKVAFVQQYSNHIDSYHNYTNQLMNNSLGEIVRQKLRNIRS